MEEGTILSRSNSDVSSPVSAACPVAEVLDRVAGKWSIGILVAAARGPVRFSELERDGLLVRTVYPSVPPKVEYILTDAAKELHDALLALTAWAERHRDTIATAQAVYDHEDA
ncbi:MAG TPA: helix-turn-helix domain-containing protein [Nonomuraea sp.]|nr:helix-turn-helix domain-containing protein [Nonomuraea sp.]